MATKWALLGLFNPFLEAASVVDVLTGQPHDEFLLLEPLHADCASLRTLLHDQGLDAVASGYRHLHQLFFVLKARQHYDFF